MLMWLLKLIVNSFIILLGVGSILTVIGFLVEGLKSKWIKD